MKIEKEIDLDIFDRTNGEVRITDAGSVYIEAGKKILNIEHQMENSFFYLATHKRENPSSMRAVQSNEYDASHFICLMLPIHLSRHAPNRKRRYNGGTCGRGGTW